MRAATFESINASQLATTTDRLLAFGRCGKRRGPHIANRQESSFAPDAIVTTIRVAPLRAAPHKRKVAKLVVIAALALVSGGAVLGVHASDAVPAIASH